MSQHDPDKLNASSRLMYQAAQDRKIDCTLFGDNETILMRDGQKRWYTRGSRISYQSSVGYTIAQKKHLTKAILQHHGLPTATFIEVRTEADLSKLNQLTFPVVMKPIAGKYGQDVIVGIKDTDAARKHYKKIQEPVIVEELLIGTEYRIVCVGFKFVAASYRKPAYVTGDGSATIQELIDKKNQHPWRGAGHKNPLTLISVDEVVTNYLAEQKLSPDSVPADNQEIPLRKTNNLSTGGEPQDMTDQVHPENKNLFEKIALATDLNVLGIDFICQNINRPVSDDPTAGVVEVNASPGLRMHHYPIIGEPRDVAGSIVEFCQSIS